MAGANNAQMKAAGWKAANVTKARAEHGRLSHGVMVAAGHSPKRFSHAAKAIGAEKKAAAGAAEAAGRARRADLAGRGLRDVAGAMMARRKANAAPSFASALEGFRSKAHAAIDADYARLGYKQTRPRLEFQEGAKYIRVVRNDGASKSAHSFVDKTTGDVFKAASWTKPAKGARGNIFQGETGLKGSGSVRYSARHEARR